MTTRSGSEEPASQESQFKRAPIAASLALIALINWFVFFGISAHIGGDALGVRPSADGFVVNSHGNRTVVTEQVWLFSLIYPYCTLMLSPAAMLLIAVRQKALQKVATPKKWLIIGFIGLWALGWYGSITKSFALSLSDYKNFKHSSQPR